MKPLASCRGASWSNHERFRLGCCVRTICRIFCQVVGSNDDAAAASGCARREASRWGGVWVVNMAACLSRERDQRQFVDGGDTQNFDADGTREAVTPTN